MLIVPLISSILMIVIIFIGFYINSDVRLLVIILLTGIIITLYDCFRNWVTFSRSINFIEFNLDKKKKITKLNNKLQEDSDIISDFINSKNLTFSVNNTKRFGITKIKIKLKNRVTIILQQLLKNDSRNNTIEIRVGMFSNTYLIEELKNHVDQNIQ